MDQKKIIIEVKIIPGASKNGVVGLENGLWKIRIHAPPEKGKANQELIDFLAEILGISKSSIALVSGDTARKKRIALQGLSEEEFTAKMEKRKEHKKSK